MKPKFIVVDIESTGLNPRKDKLHGIGIAFSEDEIEYYPAWNVPQSVRDILADPTVEKIGWRTRFDLKFLLCNGYTVKGRWWCGKVLAHALDENSSTGLKDVALRYLGSDCLQGKEALDRAIAHAGVKSLDKLHAIDLLDPAHPYLATIAEYCKEDCLNTYRLWYVLGDKLKAADKVMKETLGLKRGLTDFYCTEAMPTEYVLLEMEMRGIRINRGKIDETREIFAAKASGLVAELNARCAIFTSRIETDLFAAALEKRKSPKGKANCPPQTFNWDSGAHVGKLFFESFEVPGGLVSKTKTGAYSLTESNLAHLLGGLPKVSPLVPVIQLFQQYQKAKKIASTYTGDNKKGIISRIEEGLTGPTIYTAYSPFLSTWRLSSSNPNMQNLPRSSPVKGFFRPHSDSAVFVHADASQVELRIAAHVSQDPEMLEAYQLGKDLHKMTAASIFGCSEEEVSDEQRQVGKTLNFLLIYDGGPGRLQDEIRKKTGMDFSMEECKEFKARYFERFKVYRAYLDSQLSFMRRYHRVICESGAVRRLPEIVMGNYLDYRSRSFNAPAQLVKKAEDYCYSVKGERDAFLGASLLFSHAKKQGYNFPIQHLGATITKLAMIQLRKAGYKIINTVHDSIDIEIEASELTASHPAIMTILESAYKLSVPLKWDSKVLNSFDEKDVFVSANGTKLVKI